MADRLRKSVSGGVVLGALDRIDADGRPNQPAAIDLNDGVETRSESLLPGQSRIEAGRWIIRECAVGLTIPAIVQVQRWVYDYSPLQHSHLLVYLGLAGWLLWLAIERINGLPYVKTWSLFSSLLVVAAGTFGLVMLLGGF